MPNRLRGEVSIPGTSYVLRYDINALCEVEEATGENVPALLARMGDGTPPSFRTMRALLWGGLRAQHPQMTIADAGKLLGDVGPQAIVALMGESLTASLGTSDEAPAEKNH